MLDPAVRGGRGEYCGAWYCSHTSSPIRPEPGRGSEIFRVPRGKGWLRFLLSIKTNATAATAPAADPITIPTFAPVVRPGASVAVELEEDEAPLAEVDEEADKPPVAVDDGESLEAVPVAAAVSLAVVAVVTT